MWTKRFWINTAERALKTVAQASVAVITLDQATPANISWQQVIIGAAIAGLVSILTSIVSSDIGPSGSPSLTADPEAARVP